MLNSREFLEAVWPDEGHYVIATPFRIPNTDKTVYAQKVFDTIADAAAYVVRERERKDVYFAVHSLHEPRVWKPKPSSSISTWVRATGSSSLRPRRWPI